MGQAAAKEEQDKGVTTTTTGKKRKKEIRGGAWRTCQNKDLGGLWVVAKASGEGSGQREALGVESAGWSGGLGRSQMHRQVQGKMADWELAATAMAGTCPMRPGPCADKDDCSRHRSADSLSFQMPWKCMMRVQET